MSTPLFDAALKYIKKDMARFHMPGHKGTLDLFNDAALFDLTEIPDLDELYRSSGVIAETESRYTRLYGSGASILCAGGGTLCVQTMLALSLKPGDTLVIARGCHTSAINQMALLDINPVWVFPECDKTTGLAKPVTAAKIRKALQKNQNARAVYITSPDYYGAMCDIKAISGACHELGLPLLVDNAHGAHLKFLRKSLHPMDQGADMCADSLHKTLPVLTGGAVLHMKNPGLLKEAKRLMSLFGSTSPSYLIMLSADAALNALENDFAGKLEITAKVVSKIRTVAENKGFLLPAGICDPLKLTLGFGAIGYNSREFGDMLHKSGIEPEMVDECFCVLMASPYNTACDFTRLRDFIESATLKSPVSIPGISYAAPECAMPLRQAVFAEACEVPVCDSLGRVAASAVAPCPPGIPVIVPGEVIDENLALAFKKCGVLRINVVK